MERTNLERPSGKSKRNVFSDFASPHTKLKPRFRRRKGWFASGYRTPEKGDGSIPEMREKKRRFVSLEFSVVLDRPSFLCAQVTFFYYSESPTCFSREGEVIQTASREAG